MILDDRNIFHPEVRAETERVWEQSETGSPEELAELGLPASFTRMRRDYILPRFDGITEPVADRPANQNRGYTLAMLEQVTPALTEGKHDAPSMTHQQ